MDTPQGTPIAATVVERVANRRECDPLDLDPLGATVDPALLDQFASSDGVLPDSTLCFHYAGFVVSVDGTGEVDVEPEATSSTE